MNYELERIWKEIDVLIEVLSWYLPEVTEETLKNLGLNS
jgi:hypothetical protein